MELIDVTVPLRPGMVVFPGDPEVSLGRVSSIAGGAVANVSRLEAGVHTGTHVDAPLHFRDGAPAVESLPLEVLVGPAEVVDATGLEREVGEDFPFPSGVERLLLKTRNSELWAREAFAEDAVALSPGAARCLVELGVRLVGIDYLSVGGEEVHRTLLDAGVVVLEGLDLRGVEPGAYRLLCLPLKLVGADGAPARAILAR